MCSWGRLDDTFDDNPKFVGIDLAAAGLWLMCQPQALRRGDGFVPEGVPLRFAQGRGSHAPSRLIAVLVQRGLWDVVEGGWLYHDFGSYSKLREKRSDAGSKGATARWQRDGKPMANDASRDGSPVPEPVPVPKVANATSPVAPKGAVMAQTFMDVWNRSCAPLPRLRKPPSGVVGQRLIAHVFDVFDDDPMLLVFAIQRAARDPHYREQHYGYETFCRHVERWVEDVVVPMGGGSGSADQWLRDRMARTGNQSTVIDIPVAVHA